MNRLWVSSSALTLWVAASLAAPSFLAAQSSAAAKNAAKTAAIAATGTTPGCQCMKTNSVNKAAKYDSGNNRIIFLKARKPV